MPTLTLARLVRSLSVALAVVAVVACSSSPASEPTVYGYCSATEPSTTAALGSWVDGQVGYTLPILAGGTQDITLTVTNSGGGDATELKDLMPATSALSFKDGLYPGAGGTCGDTLPAGASCTLVLTLVGPMTGTETSLVVLQYFTGAVYATSTRQIEAMAIPATAFAPAPHAPLPQATQSGGATLGVATLVTASFADAFAASEVSAFGDWIVGSKWLQTVGADYGVGLRAHRHVDLADATPTTIVNGDFADYVDRSIANGALPTVDDGLYVFFLSSAVTVTDVLDAGGWHGVSPKGNVYAIVLAACGGTEAQALDEYTFVAGHEILEALTDPLLTTGYRFDVGEGELADVCDETVRDGGYALPTIWSNSAAATGGDPCVPASGNPYVDVDPSPSVVQIPAGSTAPVTVTLTGWSTLRVGDWRVSASVVGEDGGAFLAALDPNAKDLLNNGESVTVTVTPASGTTAGMSAALVVSSYAPALPSSVTGMQFIPIVVTDP